ncbi:proteophosphoglycan ppg4 [Heterostelium album PN500]|uniref:Proteophosphoglycan ppg4 n=1 Tax=Heterostelium pallidum (strain ATCC 26659 / Pp 5 / PN500) TaxID=670386 RepID=D3AVJ8_HETP5|nr:proteophosphoglycan ppg4 [Heterostelium album PN500]EFA86321.1 proteophosphoglycan ppg4 [Heterostelium album PN500]|eukprot:XP_020438426.1 proteophosphoglycan ppg4 [Heterostelium album PN500]
MVKEYKSPPPPPPPSSTKTTTTTSTTSLSPPITSPSAVSPLIPTIPTLSSSSSKPIQFNYNKLSADTSATSNNNNTYDKDFKMDIDSQSTLAHVFPSPKTSMASSSQSSTTIHSTASTTNSDSSTHYYNDSDEEFNLLDYYQYCLENKLEDQAFTTPSKSTLQKNCESFLPDISFELERSCFSNSGSLYIPPPPPIPEKTSKFAFVTPNSSSSSTKSLILPTSSLSAPSSSNPSPSTSNPPPSTTSPTTTISSTKPQSSNTLPKLLKLKPSATTKSLILPTSSLSAPSPSSNFLSAPSSSSNSLSAPSSSNPSPSTSNPPPSTTSPTTTISSTKPQSSNTLPKLLKLKPSATTKSLILPTSSLSAPSPSSNFLSAPSPTSNPSPSTTSTTTTSTTDSSRSRIETYNHVDKRPRTTNYIFQGGRFVNERDEYSLQSNNNSTALEMEMDIDYPSTTTTTTTTTTPNNNNINNKYIFGIDCGRSSHVSIDEHGKTHSFSVQEHYLNLRSRFNSEAQKKMLGPAMLKFESLIPPSKNINDICLDRSLISNRISYLRLHPTTTRNYLNIRLDEYNLIMKKNNYYKKLFIGSAKFSHNSRGHSSFISSATLYKWVKKKKHKALWINECYTSKVHNACWNKTEKEILAKLNNKVSNMKDPPPCALSSGPYSKSVSIDRNQVAECHKQLSTLHQRVTGYIDGTNKVNSSTNKSNERFDYMKHHSLYSNQMSGNNVNVDGLAKDHPILKVFQEKKWKRPLCRGCGHFYHRDKNAARNILLLGILHSNNNFILTLF